LAFVDPQCGPCTALLPELSGWQRELASQVTLAIITSGTVEANSAKVAGQSLVHVLLQKKREVSEAYRAYGTPSMVIVEADGTISSPVAGGRDGIRGLMARFTAAQHQPGDADKQQARNLALNGSNGAHGGVGAMRLQVGEAAPDLRLPDIDGKQVTLAAFRGHETLVLFWNPSCGFCLKMLDDFKAWETSRTDVSPKLLVVSTGSAETNRAMGLRSPVVLDAGFETARSFGAGGTPSAVLVDEGGRVASEVVVGGPAVLALATKPALTLKMGARP
jgi:peroxiredoxin